MLISGFPRGAVGTFLGCSCSQKHGGFVLVVGYFAGGLLAYLVDVRVPFLLPFLTSTVVS